MDIGPLCTAAAERENVPLVVLLAMLWAESNLTRTALRQGIWPDWSAGMSQITVQTAARYGLGDGTPASWGLVQEALFDRETSINLGARHLAQCWRQAERWGERELQALLAFNSGTPQTPGNWYWEHYASHIARYQQALTWAQRIAA